MPASLGACRAAMTFPGEKRRYVGQLLDEVFDGLYGYAMVLCRDRTEAEDLVQETCFRAVKAIESLQPGSNAKSWLFTILRNIWLNQVRQRRAIRCDKRSSNFPRSFARLSCCASMKSCPTRRSPFYWTARLAQ